MQAGELYRLNEDMVAIEPKVGWPIMDLPEGAIIMVVNGSPDHRWFVNVIWEQKALCVFTVDLRERASLVEEFSFSSVGPEQVTTKTGWHRFPATSRRVERS
jgi:hypothetical protein